jgi:hypothetical protein
LFDSDFRNFSLILLNVQGSKGFILLTKALENVAQFKYVIGRFVANEKKMFIDLTKQIFLPSV